jgi:hypothetical protein
MVNIICIFQDASVFFFMLDHEDWSNIHHFDMVLHHQVCKVQMDHSENIKYQYKHFLN